MITTMLFEHKWKVYINFQEPDRLYGRNVRSKITKCPWCTYELNLHI